LEIVQKTSGANVVRNVIDIQIKLGETDISEITFNKRSRDEMVKILRGLKFIYSDSDIRKEVFEVLEKLQTKNNRTGRQAWIFGGF